MPVCLDLEVDPMGECRFSHPFYTKIYRSKSN